MPETGFNADMSVWLAMKHCLAISYRVPRRGRYQAWEYFGLFIEGSTIVLPAFVPAPKWADEPYISIEITGQEVMKRSDFAWGKPLVDLKDA